MTSTGERANPKQESSKMGGTTAFLFLATLVLVVLGLLFGRTTEESPGPGREAEQLRVSVEDKTLMVIAADHVEESAQEEAAAKAAAEATSKPDARGAQQAGDSRAR